MSKVLFTVQYEIKPEDRDEYLVIVRELKTLMKNEQLEDYKVFENKGKGNHFLEIYTFKSFEDYENFDDNQSERVNILLNKLSDISISGQTKYATFTEVNGEE